MATAKPMTKTQLIATLAEKNELPKKKTKAKKVLKFRIAKAAKEAVTPLKK